MHSGYSQNTLGWCHMYDVLVYKMLWDRKKILNISLWKIIRLSMRPATGLCPHISLERILVYTVLVLERVFCTCHTFFWSKGLWKSSFFFEFYISFYRQRVVDGSSKSSDPHYLVMRLHNLLHVIDDGFYFSP